MDRPTRFEGMMKIGSTIRVSRVSRHSSHSMAMSVVTSVMTLLRTEPTVVTAPCAPITSLLSRLMSAPVCVRVKNAIGMRWTLSKSVVRSWKMRPSPTLAWYHRWTMPSPASTRATRTVMEARTTTSVRSPSGMAVSRMARKSKGGARPISASKAMVTRKPKMGQR